MRQGEWQGLQVAELVQATQPEPVCARHAPAQEQIDEWWMVQGNAPNSNQVPEFIFDFDLAGEAVP